MNDIPRLVATVAVWLILGATLTLLGLRGALGGALLPVAILLVVAAIVSVSVIWQGQEKRAEARARAKRGERLAQHLAEERLDEEDLVILEELLEEQRARRSEQSGGTP